MRGTYITASIIAFGILLWLGSGQLDRPPQPDHPTLAEANEIRAAESQDAVPVPVRARVIHASLQRQSVVLRGRTENKRSLVVKAETTGRIIERPIERGTKVSKGDLLCRLSEDDRQASLREAVEALNQARIDYVGSLKLKQRSLLSESSVAQARARVASAQALVKRREVDIERSAIRAPFPAIVEDIEVEIGDYVSPGTPCVTLVDMDPMLLVGRVTEQYVRDLTVGQNVTGQLSDGREVIGELRFVGQQSDPATRTYAIEAEVPNPDFGIRSGITARIQIPTHEVMAQKVSPAIFSLDDEGHIGIRTVSAADVVEYHIVEIVRDDTDGVWVTGLPEIATVITVGQEMVVPGQRVQVTYEPSTTLPASTAPADANQPRERDGEARNTPVTVARETLAVRPDPSSSSTTDATSNRI